MDLVTQIVTRQVGHIMRAEYKGASFDQAFDPKKSVIENHCAVFSESLHAFIPTLKGQQIMTCCGLLPDGSVGFMPIPETMLQGMIEKMMGPVV